MLVRSWGFVVLVVIIWQQVLHLILRIELSIQGRLNVRYRNFLRFKVMSFSRNMYSRCWDREI